MMSDVFLFDLNINGNRFDARQRTAAITKIADYF